MAHRVSQSELAALAGVSRATVSRALAGHPAISEQVTQRVRTIARKLNYRPSAAARSFVTRRSQTIGLVLCDRALTSHGYAALAGAVEKAARGVGLKLQLSFCDSSELDHEQLPPIFRDDGIDGVIITGSFPDWLLQRMTTWSMPFVLMGTRPQTSGVNHVTGDAYEGGRLIAEYFLQLGHREMGLLVGPRKSSLHAAYFQGFRDACQVAGLDQDQVEAMVEECADHDAIPPLRRLFDRKPGITALFADTDPIAWQVMQCLRAAGKRVPEDVSVAGAGGEAVASLVPPGRKLTSVDVRYTEMGRAAVEHLQDLIERPGASARRISICPRLALGDTTTRLTQATSSSSIAS